MKKLGLIAGDKNLPLEIQKWAKANNTELFIAGIKGCVNPHLKDSVSPQNYIEPHLSQLSKVIKFFKLNKVDTIVLAGGVNNSSIKITFDVIRLFTKLLFMKNKYDGILRLVIKEFEKNNIKVIGIDEILTNNIITKGVHTKTHPTETQLKEIKGNWAKALDFASNDLGQSIIVFNGTVIATESFKGTDELISRAIKIKENKKGGILLKVLKPHQERRADLPVIGERTIQNLINGNFSGIAIDAGNAIFEDKEKVIALANSNNIFIIAL